MLSPAGNHNVIKAASGMLLRNKGNIGLPFQIHKLRLIHSVPSKDLITSFPKLSEAETKTFLFTSMPDRFPVMCTLDV